MKEYVGVVLVFCVFQVIHSYVLLTANLDDVQAIARRMASAPIASELKKLYQGAYRRLRDDLVKLIPRQRNTHGLHDDGDNQPRSYDNRDSMEISSGERKSVANRRYLVDADTRKRSRRSQYLKSGNKMDTADRA